MMKQIDWDACTKEYERIIMEYKEYSIIDTAIIQNLEKENDELRRQLEIAIKALKEIEHGNGLMRDASRSEQIALRALNDLESTGE